jgi:hypothetical protein
MNLILHISLLGVLVALTVATSLYRRWLENHCDNYLHLHSDTHDATLVETQAGMCKRLEGLSKVRTALIIATIVYAVAIAGFATYEAWSRSGLQ